MSTLPRRLFLVAVPCLVTALWSSDARADAVEVARKGVARIDSLHERCTNAIIDETLECLRVINALLEEGNVERAREVAEECIRRVHNLADLGIEAIGDVAARCINILLNEYGAERLAHRVRAHAAEAIEDIEHLERRAVNAIRAQFGD
jgi:hypothetical protein